MGTVGGGTTALPGHRSAAPRVPPLDRLIFRFLDPEKTSGPAWTRPPPRESFFHRVQYPSTPARLRHRSPKDRDGSVEKTTAPCPSSHPAPRWTTNRDSG